MTDVSTDPAVLAQGTSLVLCRAGSRTCGIPLAHVVETLRLAHVEPILGAAACTLGLMMIRGTPTPIVSLGRLLGVRESERETRLVTLRSNTRVVGLSVDEVLGVRSFAATVTSDLPPLFKNSASQLLEAVATLDSALFLVLQSSRLLSDEMWAELWPSRSEA